MPDNIASVLTTDFLMKGVIIPLQSRLAPLNAFTKQFEPDPVKPLATVQIKVAGAASDTQVDPTNFAGGDSTLNAASVIMHQLSHPWHLTNQQFNSGIELKDLFEINVQKFARTILDTVMAPVTTPNFPGSPFVMSAAAFGISDLDNLWAAIAKSPIKNLILSGNYFIRIANKPGFYQPTGTESGAGWKPFGWDFIGQNDEWSGAEPNTWGFACNPQALGVVLGLPLQMDMPNVITTVLPLPGVKAKALLNVWMDANARTVYCTLDVMLGTTLLDGTAGVLVKSQ